MFRNGRRHRPDVTKLAVGTVTANGALVHVAGPALTSRSPAECLQRVGVVRGMTLEITPKWVTCNLYSDLDAVQQLMANGSKLDPQIDQCAASYLGPAEVPWGVFQVSLP